MEGGGPRSIVYLQVQPKMPTFIFPSLSTPCHQPELPISCARAPVAPRYLPCPAFSTRFETAFIYSNVAVLVLVRAGENSRNLAVGHGDDGRCAMEIAACWWRSV